MSSSPTPVLEDTDVEERISLANDISHGTSILPLSNTQNTKPHSSNYLSSITLESNGENMDRPANTSMSCSLLAEPQANYDVTNISRGGNDGDLSVPMMQDRNDVNSPIIHTVSLSSLGQQYPTTHVSRTEEESNSSIYQCSRVGIL